MGRELRMIGWLLVLASSTSTLSHWDAKSLAWDSPPADLLRGSAATFYPCPEGTEAKTVSAEQILYKIFEIGEWRDPILLQVGRAGPYSSATSSASFSGILPPHPEGMLRLLENGQSCIIQLELLDHAALSSIPLFRDELKLSEIISLFDSMFSEIIPEEETLLLPQTTAHIYITGPGGSALPPHWDAGNIVIRQLSGEKEWLVWDHTADQTREDEPKG